MIPTILLEKAESMGRREVIDATRQAILNMPPETFDPYVTTFTESMAVRTGWESVTA